jgi:hypothetical protein
VTETSFALSERRLVWIGAAVVAIILAITLLSLWAFSTGDEVPGSGTGETLTTP